MGSFLSTSNSLMITISVENFNTFSQRFYDSVIALVQIHQLTCKCGHSACLTLHGSYHRYVQTPDDKVKIKVTRVKCSACGKTHALLISSLVPYSQIPLEEQRQIIKSVEGDAASSEICEDHPQVDENCIKSIIRRYKKHWKERLKSEQIPLEPPTALIRRCLKQYSKQFMQIRSTFNRLYVIPT